MERSLKSLERRKILLIFMLFSDELCANQRGRLFMTFRSVAGSKTLCNQRTSARDLGMPKAPTGSRANALVEGPGSEAPQKASVSSN